MRGTPWALADSTQFLEIDSPGLHSHGTGWVYAKPAFGGPPSKWLRLSGQLPTIEWPFPNHRLVGLRGKGRGRVSLRWKGITRPRWQARPADPLSPTEFFTALLFARAPPKGFVRTFPSLRIFSRIACAFLRLALCRQLMNSTPPLGAQKRKPAQFPPRVLYTPSGSCRSAVAARSASPGFTRCRIIDMCYFDSFL